MSARSELKKHYRNGRLLPFLGAGTSMAVKWPDPASGAERRGLSWAEFVDQAAKHLGYAPELLRMRGDGLQILEYYRIKESGLGSLVNWLMAEMRAPDAAITSSKIHQELVRMDNCKTLYTTNYDDYLERAFQLHGVSVKKVALEAHMGANGGSTEIVKFHGDFGWHEHMVVSESDYMKRLTFNSAMDWRLRSDLLGRSVLFIGYSFQDSNVAYLFHMVNDLFQALPDSSSGRRAFIVVPDPSDFEEALFRRRNIEVLPVSRASLEDEIVALLREIRS